MNFIEGHHVQLGRIFALSLSLLLLYPREIIDWLERKEQAGAIVVFLALSFLLSLIALA
jgi:hypothetical protein